MRIGSHASQNTLKSEAYAELHPKIGPQDGNDFQHGADNTTATTKTTTATTTVAVVHMLRLAEMHRFRFPKRSSLEPAFA